MISLKDQLGNLVQLNAPAQRIVSLVPSQTELLQHYGLENETVGITKFCVHPREWFKNKERIGGTKNVDIEKVKKLNPDLIIGNKEENTPDDIHALQKDFPVYISDIVTFDDAFQMMKDVGILCGKEQVAVDLIDAIREDVEDFPKFSGTVLYAIWKDPYMVCGTHNFIHSVLEKIGLTNLIKEPRYVEITKEEIIALNPDYLLLSSEPYPFSTKNILEFRTLEDTRIFLVDGEIFSWYGSRMLKMKDYFKELAL
ncbi:MAG: ABC transporter substrate-binding protein [Crocinitomicaceae bacterium]|nr:ABC transporter substrate-binding protein [Crocinitomicaceae bacterium]